MSHTSLRRDIYLLLSEAYKQPTEPFIAEQPAMVDFLTQAFHELGYALPAELYENWPVLLPNLPTAIGAYRRSFLLPIQSCVVPVESIYRRWTVDASAEVPFAADKGLLLSDHGLHMKALYDSFEIMIPVEFQSMPDHICLELEFAALLLEQQTEEQVRLFLAEHLNWLDELADDAEKHAIPTYYRQLIKLTAQFLALELRRHEQ